MNAREAFFERAAAHAGMPFVALDPPPGGRDPVDESSARLLSPWSARALDAIPIALDGATLIVALADPTPEHIATLRALARRPVRVVVAAPDALARARERVYGPESDAQPAAAAAATPTVRRNLRALAHHAALDYVDLDPEKVDPAVAQALPATLSRRFGVLALGRDGDVLRVATSEPFDELALRVLRIVAGVEIELVVAEEQQIAAAVDRAFAADAPAAAALPPELAAAAQQNVPHLLGELLVTTGLITRNELLSALHRQERTGDRLGVILLHAGALSEYELAGALADQLRVPLLDVSRFSPDKEAVQLVPEQLARQHRFVPLALSNHVLYLATAEPLGLDALHDIRRHTSLQIRIVLTSKRALERLLQRTYSDRWVRLATTDLLNRLPEESSYRVLSPGQKVAGAVMLFLAALALVKDPVLSLIVFNIVSVTFYSSFSLYKFKLIYDALGHTLELPVTAEEIEALDEATLPVFTILVPLYREAAVVPRLTAALNRLDYPVTRLDVKLIVEEDDEETIAALREEDLPPQFRLVVVPDAMPKTKPKACNYGLIQAEGKYVVIYDAEDRPEPDQLKKVVVGFSKAEDRIVCIQCKLNYYNRSQNILTRWFTTEYSNWFDLLMPGLDAADAPIPLGGTSNHFLRDKLIELGAWDPFNVTEDADLGIRLHKAGYKTAIIDSTTFEEANSDLYNWIRQRSRWVKGYIQTWLVQMRHPVRLWRQLGTRSFFSFQMIIGGTFFSFLLNPVYWLLTTSWVMTQAGWIRQLFPGFVYYAAAFGLYIGNFTFTYINVAGAMRRGYHDLVKYALLSPLYWALMSIGAYKGLAQLIYRPHYWEKTVHGLDLEISGTNEAARPQA
ncbi:MAG TPA: glycosyltransferase family 2 protein [Gaiellaceae bacterium]